MSSPVYKDQVYKKLYSPHSRSRHLSTIPLKDYHLFKIAESAYNNKKNKKLVKLTKQF